ncbi:MAG TPA: helix-turn-helix domain-containing protein [Nocardioides sp.]|uniref:helix-turn-helix transcriptional regulator n=1 Tax=Nocardioides sp. TaxID=35761 RepID=UPI002F40E805
MGDAFSAIGALADPLRRRLYEYVAGRDDGVGREEVAREVGVPPHTARFHLDKLVEEGLLTVEHRRLSGRTGPGAGRPAKVYRRAAGELAVSLPERGYDLVGRVFAAAVERSLEGAPLPETLAEEARQAGRRDGTAYEGKGGELARSADVLADRGYEPTRVGDGLVLRNCPFDALAREHTALVCGVNHDYVGGVLDGLGCDHTSARLDPGPDRCCVRVEERPGRA